LQLSIENKHKTVHEELDTAKHVHADYQDVCLTQEHKNQCFKIALSHLQWFQDKGNRLLDSRVTGNEMCVNYSYLIPQIKQAIRLWQHSTSPTAKKFKVCQTAGKVAASVLWNAEVIII
jgi:hypothetical protein